MNKHYSVEGALDAVLLSEDGEYAVLLREGGLEFGCYRPRGEDRQSPHDRHELYVVQTGRGDFVNEGERRTFMAGDAFFVPSGAEHRFENFTPDFAAWVFFFGSPKDRGDAS